ncbi:MAG: helix-turn-helix domain-containing protein [Desulfobaccales bacterium]
MGPTYQETKKLLLQKSSIEQISNKRGLSVGTIIAHIEKLVRSSEKLDLDYLRPPAEEYARIVEAFQETGGKALSPMRELLGKQFSFEELRLVRLFMKF